jgi:hypothetical protein
MRAPASSARHEDAPRFIFASKKPTAKYPDAALVAVVRASAAPAGP